MIRKCFVTANVSERVDTINELVDEVNRLTKELEKQKKG